MKFWTELIESAGLFRQRKELAIMMLAIPGVFGLLLYLITGVLGLAICLALLALGAEIEILRLKANARRSALDKVWPAVFDSFQNAAQAGIGLEEQLGYLAQKGPLAVRQYFQEFETLLDRGVALDLASSHFRSRAGHRQADYLTLMLELSSELGGRSMASNWEKAANEIRTEQAVIGQVLAKQGWVAGSAKVALLAPWLISLVLIQVPQNRVAFASELGALILVLGLALSLVAYSLVNRLGRLPVPGRLFYANS
jgi:tight adherence protein B